jgi:hypothetical protein
MSHPQGETLPAPPEHLITVESCDQHLADLRAVWPSATPAQRAEIAQRAKAVEVLRVALGGA